MYRRMTFLDQITVDFGEALKALANPVRRKILGQMKDLERNFPGQEHPYALGVCAGKIGGVCGLSQSTISAHLAVLQHSRLITGKRVGQWIFYKRNEAAIMAFLERMEESL
jgi:DNA-binding transcriptional ArsR family regulator